MYKTYCKYCDLTVCQAGNSCYRYLLVVIVVIQMQKKAVFYSFGKFVKFQNYQR